ncbi:MAG: hypothetical protein ACKOXK_02945 [Chakrabartia sp.]
MSAFLLALAAASPAVLPAPLSGSHCAADEVALFSSRMGTALWNTAHTRKKVKGDKVLSICVDQLPGPKKVAIRFGKPGALELDTSGSAPAFRMTSQTVGGDESWTALSFDKDGISWSVVAPEGGDARDVFLVASREGAVLARTEAIDEGEHWQRILKKFGKKKKAVQRAVPASLADIPPSLAPRVAGALDVEKIAAARYAANLKTAP